MRTLALLVLLPALAIAQTDTNAPAATPPTGKSDDATAAALQKAVDQLTKSNRELLELLKKQQAVLEDMQFDRRLQSRQIQSLETRMEETLLQNAQLQNKITNMANAASMPPSLLTNAASGTPPSNGTNAASAEPPPPPPDTYLPEPSARGMEGTKWWHRLFTLKGTDNQTSNLFKIEGKSWRLHWHNLDKPGKAFANTSALFINAFPKDDTIPQKACSKLGTGGGTAELSGPGTYYIKVEASGGSWELAVEDFR